ARRDAGRERARAVGGEAAHEVVVGHVEHRLARDVDLLVGRVLEGRVGPERLLDGRSHAHVEHGVCGLDAQRDDVAARRAVVAADAEVAAPAAEDGPGALPAVAGEAGRAAAAVAAGPAAVPAGSAIATHGEQQAQRDVYPSKHIQVSLQRFARSIKAPGGRRARRHRALRDAIRRCGMPSGAGRPVRRTMTTARRREAISSRGVCTRRSVACWQRALIALVALLVSGACRESARRAPAEAASAAPPSSPQPASRGGGADRLETFSERRLEPDALRDLAPPDAPRQRIAFSKGRLAWLEGGELRVISLSDFAPVTRFSTPGARNVVGLTGGGFLVATDEHLLRLSA